LIVGNSGFTQANGVTGGSGIPSDPFVIGQWQISAPSGNGITIVNSTNYFVIQGAAISSAIRGIYLHNVTNGMVRNSAISASSYGVLVEQSSSTSISNNVVSNNGEGILIDNCAKISIVRNQIYSTPIGSAQAPGLVISFSSGSIISNNNIWSSGNAVSLTKTSNAILAGNNVSYNLGTALSLTSSPNANITGSIFAHNLVGISLTASANVSITGSTLYWNRDYGIDVSPGASNNVTIAKNVIAFNGEGVRCCYAKVATIRGNNFTRDGLILFTNADLPYVSLTITNDNLVNGKPLLFYRGCSNLDINGIPVGELILMNCNNIRITKVEISNTVTGMQLFNVNNTLITSNNINSNTGVGINLSSFTNITVTGNNLSNNGGTSYRAGLSSPPVAVTPLIAYHNNLFYDGIFGDTNAILDNGYPSGGNYWSFYTGVDNCRGPYQNICPSPDGIGDTPLISGPSYAPTDRYPQMRPYLPTPDTSPPVWLTNTQLTVTDVAQTHATLYWMRATDNVAVVSYQVYQESTLIATVSADILIHSDPYLAGDGYLYIVGNLTAGKAYTFRIVAVDEAGNRSVSGLTANISTPPQPQQPPTVFSSAWWQQYWYFVALAGGAGAGLLGFLVMRWRRRVLVPMKVVTPDSSKPSQ
jgi:parallel beta-helix repeat protein